MYDAQSDNATDWTASSDHDATSTESQTQTRLSRFQTKWASGQINARRAFHYYLSASNLILGRSHGDSRWLASVGVAGALSFALLGVGLAAVMAPYSGVETAALTADDAPQILAHLPENKIYSPSSKIALAPPADVTAAADDEARTSTADQMAAVTPVSTAPARPEVFKETIAMSSGDTLMQVLTDAGVASSDAHYAIAALMPLYSPSKIRAGQKISLTFKDPVDVSAEDTSDETSAGKLLTAISFQPDVERAIKVERTKDGSYTSLQIKRELTSAYVHARGSITSSLFLDADRAGIPAPIIIGMIRMFSYSIDFQRELQAGDSFEVYFDRKYDADGVAVKEGDISYAEMKVGGKSHKLWRFQMADGSWDYFDEGGNSMRKFLMKTPIDGARISSSFGMRKHPILGYSKLHSGVDFAAPRGTPIYAAGDGVVKKAGVVRGYGNYILIKHANRYETAYAHMKGFAKGIKSGTRVHQGQVIGYVGTTGRSTGPHLHYEVHLAGKKMNPLSLKVATGVKLEGKQLAAFKRTRDDIITQMAKAPVLTKVAQVASGSNKQAN